jgi:hypothetical protein
LDVADAYLRRDWHTALNSYWSPLYSWLLALAFLIVKPSTYWKFAVLHLTNFVIYLFALGCFDFLIHELIRSHRDRRAKLFAGNFVILPDWAWLALGYPLVLWVSIYVIGISQESPDMIVAAVLYLASGILLRIQRQRQNWLLFVLLGIVLGFGYLAKTVMFPLSFVFLAVGVFSVGDLRRALPRVLIALVLFLFIAGPFIFAISRAKGRFTFGDAGRLNFLWVIDGNFPIHWQGGLGNGTPKHPTRKILDDPPIYEFGEPVGGTYPFWYDPSYWYEGAVGHFDLRGQLRALGTSIYNYYELVSSGGVQYGLLVGLLTLYLMSRRGWKLVSDIGPYWCLIIPAVAGLGSYSLINVQERYVASFLVLLWLALFSGARLPSTIESQRLLASITIVLMTIMVVTITASSTSEARITAHDLIAGEDPAANENWRVADGLRQMGVEPGDKVACIGESLLTYWAHLAGVRVIAEIETMDIASFWAADTTVKKRVIETFARTGAKVIVTVPPVALFGRDDLGRMVCGDLNGWQKIGTEHYVYVLPN